MFLYISIIIKLEIEVSVLHNIFDISMNIQQTLKQGNCLKQAILIPLEYLTTMVIKTVYYHQDSKFKCNHSLFT